MRLTRIHELLRAYIIIGCYAVGFLGAIMGVVLRTVATALQWGPRSSRLEGWAVAFSVPMLIFGMPMLLILGYPIIMSSDAVAAWIDINISASTFYTLWHAGGALLSFILGMPLGWFVGPDRAPQYSAKNPFVPSADNPFGAPDSSPGTNAVNIPPAEPILHVGQGNRSDNNQPP